MAIVSRKKQAIIEHNKERFTEIKYPKIIIDKESYYKDEIKRLETINNELNKIILSMKPLELFRDMLSFKCLQTSYTITIIQCTARKNRMGCNCINRRKIFTDYLNTT